MTSTLDDLVGVLREEARGLRRLLPLLEEQERVLLAADARVALDLAERQATMGAELRALERRRQAVAAQVAGELGLSGATLTLSALLARMKPAPAELLRLRTELRDLGSRVVTLTRRNAFLLERSIRYVNGLLQATVAVVAPPPTTYAASGRAESRAAAALGVVDRRA